MLDTGTEALITLTLLVGASALMLIRPSVPAGFAFALSLTLTPDPDWLLSALPILEELVDAPAATIADPEGVTTALVEVVSTDPERVGLDINGEVDVAALLGIVVVVVLVRSEVVEEDIELTASEVLAVLTEVLAMIFVEVSRDVLEELVDEETDDVLDEELEDVLELLEDVFCDVFDVRVDVGLAEVL